MVDVRRHASKAADPGDPRLIVGCTLSSALFAVARPHRASILCFHTASADSGLRAGRLASLIAGTVSVSQADRNRQFDRGGNSLDDRLVYFARPLARPTSRPPNNSQPIEIRIAALCVALDPLFRS
jgi:hypothetical protein